MERVVSEALLTALRVCGWCAVASRLFLRARVRACVCVLFLNVVIRYRTESAFVCDDGVGFILGVLLF